MNLIECQTNHTERKTPPQSPSEDLGVVSDPMRNSELLGKMESLVGDRPKRPNGKLTSAGDVLIPILIAEGAFYDGEVFVWPNGKKSRPQINAAGYRKISKRLNDEKTVCFSLARFVCWKAHGAPPVGKPWVDHKNRNRADDTPSNLHWISPSGNAQNVSSKAWETRADSLLKATALRCKPKASLNALRVRAIRTLSQSNLFTQDEMASLFHISQSSIMRALYQKTAGLESELKPRERISQVTSL